MDIIFKGRHTDVPERFRKHAIAKLSKVEKLDHKAMRIDVEVTVEHNPRQADRKERVELTITTKGPAIRAEAAAEDRFAALDLALAKLESRLRRSCDRRKDRHGLGAAHLPARPQTADHALDAADAPDAAVAAGALPLTASAPDGAEAIVAIEMQGDGPLVVREKMHRACPMTIDQALFEMELVGHDFFLFTDTTDGLPSVVYRRRGYQYGVIRLAEQAASAEQAGGGRAGEQLASAAR